MANTEVRVFVNRDGSILYFDWLDQIEQPKARAKVLLAVERLAGLGHELRRPEADFLRDGIYELRIGFRGQTFRVLYFFHGQLVAIVSHGIVKERVVPPQGDRTCHRPQRGRRAQPGPPRRAVPRRCARHAKHAPGSAMTRCN